MTPRTRACVDKFTTAIATLLLVGVLGACNGNTISNLSTQGAVLFSEIMYHPVEENAQVDNHEFVEIYNHTDSTIDLSGWFLTGSISYTFPEGSSIAPNSYQVIARNQAALAAIGSYKLSAGTLLGDYSGELDNGGGSVNLVDPGFSIIDSVTYSDSFPWPYGADELGASDRWLGLLQMPLTEAPHQYRGRSLERMSFEVPSDEVSNWVPSPLDGATPGRANSQNGTPPAIVLTKKVTWSGSDLLIRSADTVKIGVSFSTLGTLKTPQLQYFVDNVELTGEPVNTVNLSLVNGVWEAMLPPQPDNAIVRYRIRGDRGIGIEVLSPRPSDPFGWWAYFVTPKITTSVSLYQLFIKKSDWNQMYDNINYGNADDRRVMPGGSAANRCVIRDSWDATLPAVFVSNGVVYDTFVRYQGSRYNRINGFALDPTKTSINPLPDRPTNTILSWKIDFPDYAPFEDKRRKIVLNKMRQACPGLDDTVGERIYGDPSIDIPVQRTRYARFHVNGGYYHLMLDLEHIDADMIKRYPAPGEPVGDLFKADGNGNVVEGPWGAADESTMTVQASCPMWTLDDRYKYTYQRLTNDWSDPAELRKMIETLNTLRTAAAMSNDYTALRSFFMATFDYQKLLDYVAIRNWAETWDDQFHNHFLYRRISDGKWLMIPQDKDLEFGEFWGWSPIASGKSFYVGETGDIDNRNGLSNRIKDAFIKSFRAELMNRIVQLDTSGVLNPTTFKAKVDEGAMTFSVADYNASPGALPCTLAGELAPMKSFADCRHQDVLDFVAAGSCTSATCGLKADYYQTLAGDATYDFTRATLRATRTDATVNFDWGGAPAAMVPADNFQVRWSGKVTPRFTGQHTFYVYADEGVRLYVNGMQLINQWTIPMMAREIAVNINLTAGMPVPITLEYFDSTGGATVRLLWLSPSPCKQPVPTARLAPM